MRVVKELVLATPTEEVWRIEDDEQVCILKRDMTGKITKTVQTSKAPKELPPFPVELLKKEEKKNILGKISDLFKKIIGKPI